MRVEVFARVKM